MILTETKDTPNIKVGYFGLGADIYTCKELF